jgi:sugar O-acyltransferase (sialic acid O-acetyltransferase NeuD family)
MAQSFYRTTGKRLFDLTIAVPAFILLSPVLAVTAILVRVWLGSPVLFRQQRPGLLGRRFYISKFRSMTDARDADGNPLPDECRLTRFGRFLRASSLDELPELWNVIKGQMSLVGPRPLKVNYLSLYTPTQARRHESVPGVTGWAQVNGRNALDWEQRFQLDVWYVDHCSLWLDLKILCMTVTAVFGRKGIAAEGHCTMPDFEGTAAPVRPRVVVIGAGGHGKVVVSTLQASGIRVDAVYDDNPERWDSDILGVPVRGPVDELKGAVGVTGVLGVGDNTIRERLSQSLPLDWLTVIHPQAFVHSSARIGEGTVVFAGAVIQPEVVVGRHAIVNTCASIDHDCRVGNFVAVCPGAHLAGAVTVGERCLLGTGCSVIPQIQIASDVIVGAGTVVIRNLPAGCTVVGTAPRYIRLVPNDTVDMRKSA